MGQARFSGNGNYTIDVDAALSSQNHNEKYSVVYWRIIVHKSNTTGHRAWGISGSSGWADSQHGGFPDLWHRVNDLEYNFQNGSMHGSFLIAEGHFRVYHDANGHASYYVNGRLDLANLGGAESGTGWRSLPHIQVATVPAAPTPIGVDWNEMTSLRFRFSGNSDGGSPIREWQIHYGRTPNGGEWAAWSNGTSHVGGLAPAQNYWFWARGRNDIGWGPFSNPISGRTIAGARVKHGGVWKEAIPYVKENGAWKLAQPYSKANGIWRKSI